MLLCSVKNQPATPYLLRSNEPLWHQAFQSYSSYLLLYGRKFWREDILADWYTYIYCWYIVIIISFLHKYRRHCLVGIILTVIFIRSARPLEQQTSVHMYISTLGTDMCPLVPDSPACLTARSTLSSTICNNHGVNSATQLTCHTERRGNQRARGMWQMCYRAIVCTNIASVYTLTTAYTVISWSACAVLYTLFWTILYSKHLCTMYNYTHYALCTTCHTYVYTVCFYILNVHIYTQLNEPSATILENGWSDKWSDHPRH